MSTTYGNDPDIDRGAAVADTPSPKGTIRLETPGLSVKDTWNAMGPGIAAAVTGIGASHIMHGPTAGAAFGYALLWVIPAAYILKYCCFEFAHRYTLVKGESVMDAYGRIGKWPFYYLGFQCLANTVGIAGRALGCGALLWAAMPFLSLEIWSVLVLFVSVAILWLGQYSSVELVVKISIVIFAVSSFVVFALQAPPPGDYLTQLAPALAPAGAMMLFGSMWGYFPTTVEVSPMQSNWAVDKGNGMVKIKQLRAQGYNVELGPDYMKNTFILFKRDMNISYIVSMLTGMVFLIIGAVVLNPLGLVPEGSEMGLTIAQIYTDTFGAWIFPLIIAGAASALFSTVFTYFDGQARIFEICVTRLRQQLNTPDMRNKLYKGFQILWLVSGTVVIFGLPEPIFVVQIASVLALFFSPVIYWLNIRSITDNFKTPEEREFLPSKFMMGLAWVGTFGLAVISAYILVLMATM